jgi:mRNA-degrading endonuclease RelE of RelBE toxin-antitoxin system
VAGAGGVHGVKAAAHSSSIRAARATRLLTVPERAALRDAIASNPELRRQGKGKSGGARVIYYWISDDEVYLLKMYAKNEQADMSAADRKAVKIFMECLKRAKEERKRR